MNMEPVRFGVIGCGLMGREFASVSMRWLHLACELPRPVIVAACDLSPKNLDWFRQVPDTKYFYSDYHELLANPEVEAVYCAVPHHLHAQVYGDVIRAGKHLIGEKPFGMDLAACEEVEAAMAGRPGVPCVRANSYCPPCSRWQWPRGRIRADHRGTLYDQRFVRHGPDKPSTGSATRDAANGDHGRMGDLGIHTQHLPFRLGVSPRTVSARWRTSHAHGPRRKRQCNPSVRTCGQRHPDVRSARKHSGGYVPHAA